jgi:mRNA interferase HicA
MGRAFFGGHERCNMKRKDLVRHLVSKGCVLSREGGKYSVFMNPVTTKEVPVTRHTEIADFTVRKICRDLGVDQP